MGINGLPARIVLAISLIIVGPSCAPPPPMSPAAAAEPQSSNTSIACSRCNEWNGEREPFKVFGNTYYVGPTGLSSVLITTPAGHILLDGALPQSAAVIAANIEKLGFHLADVRVIANSHAHFDHAGGIASLQKLSGARVVASAKGATALTAGHPTADDRLPCDIIISVHPEFTKTDDKLCFPAFRNTEPPGATASATHISAIAMTTKIREPARIVTAHRQTEGGGFIVRRPLPTMGVQLVDPFLLLDELGPVDYKPYEAVGAPDHPHRGFETVTYALAGEFEHKDSAGHSGTMGPGDVQWMTAGAGIVHAEMPSRKITELGGRVHGFQVWVNLPARSKMTRPRYQEVKAERIPQATSADGLATVRVIAGEALGTKAVIGTHTPIVYQDWSIAEGADVTLPLGAEYNALVYVFEGSAQVGDADTALNDGQMAILGEGEALRLRGVAGGGRLLLLAGVPLSEPVARYGPFVMNTRDELIQAFSDFESGRMGEITRSAQLD
ncbi:MAG: pirin family protein [Polyangiaceae bacterium]